MSEVNEVLIGRIVRLNSGGPRMVVSAVTVPMSGARVGQEMVEAAHMPYQGGEPVILTLPRACWEFEPLPVHLDPDFSEVGG